MSKLARRLKEARVRKGISQELLGIEAGLEPASARARVSRYELAQRVPDMAIVERLGRVLDIPAAYLYAESEEEAELLLAFHRLSVADRALLLDYAKVLGK